MVPMSLRSCRLQGATPRSRGTKCPSFACNHTLEKERAQGMPGAVAPAASCAGHALGNAHEFSAGTTEHTPASPAQWFTAYTRSPRSAGLVSLRRLRLRHRKLDTSVGVPGPRDFTVRLARRSSCGRNASIASPLHVRDDRPKRPSCRSGMGADNHIFPKNGS